MFSAARIKLTLWYLAIVMLISSMFSLVIYRMLSNEVTRLELAQRTRIQRGLTFDLPPNVELIEETNHRIQSRIITANLIIWVASGGLAYFLSGLTLNPIAEMVEEQHRFISDASHELRTPLTSLKAAFEVYLRGKPSTKESTGLIKESLTDVNKLQLLSESLLQLAQYQKPNGHSHMDKVQITEVVEEALKKVQPIAKKRSITLKKSLASKLIQANKESLVDLLVILLDNAIKYSPTKSGVEVTVTKSKNSVLVSVTDHGVGINKNDLPHIWDRFYRADSARTKTGGGGYGLGLPIAKKIAELHHGSLSATSVVDKGSSFILKLPA